MHPVPHRAPVPLGDRAWSYPEPYGSVIDRVGTDVIGDVASCKEIDVA